MVDLGKTQVIPRNERSQKSVYLPATNYLKSLLDFRVSLVICRRHVMWTEEVDHKPSINRIKILINH